LPIEFQLNIQVVKFLSRLLALSLASVFLYLIAVLFDLPDRFFGLLIILFSVCLSASCYMTVSKQLGISDPVFIFSSFLTLYTITPVAQTVVGFNFFALNSIYSYSDFDVFLHASRFILFNFVVIFTYFIFIDIFNNHQSRFSFNIVIFERKKFYNDKYALFVAVFIFLLSFFTLTILAAPVETYYDNYTKYDHLPSSIRTLVSVLKRLYWGILPILVVLVLFNFKEKKIIASFFIVLICAVDLIVSKGSRINTLIVVVQALVVYNLLVSRINLARLFYLVLPFIFFMALIELVRLSSGNLDLQELSLVPGEFNALFFPSIELFKMREIGVLPYYSELMLYKDIYYLIPFFNNPDADPMNWYWVNFHPHAEVAPFTMGPIADSAFFGSWFAIFFRGILLAINIFILRCILLYVSKSWLSFLIFSYCVSISILALKYSVFTYQEQMIKNLLPTLLIFLICCLILKFFIKVMLNNNSWSKNVSK